jgi:hypothetical protein
VRLFLHDVPLATIKPRHADKHCYSFQAIHGEEVNPPGQEGNVHISFQANRSIAYFGTTITIQPL